MCASVAVPKQLIDNGELGEITNSLRRFFSMYGSDPMGLLSWRFLVDQAGQAGQYRHPQSLGRLGTPVGGIARFRNRRDVIKQRPLPTSGGTHYDPWQARRSHRRGDHEDYIGMMCPFERARARSSLSIDG